MPVRSSAAARRYAQAAFEIARETDQLDGWQSDLESLAAAWEETDFAAALENPRIPLNTRMELLRRRLGDVAPLVLNLACLLLIRGRLGLAGGIVQAYGILLDAHRGIERAEVTTAVPLEESEREGISRRLAETLGKEIRLTARVDPQIIGGLVARIGDRLLDGSTRNKLISLKKTLIEAG